MCGPAEDMEDAWAPAIPLSELERSVLDRELQLGLHRVRFEEFERAIMRYGYTGRLTDQMLTEIKGDIHLQAEDLTNRNAITHFYFQDEHAFDHGNYLPHKILLLGFLLCKHKDTKKAGDALWGLVNPNFDEKIPKEKVKTLLADMCVYAIDVPFTFQNFQEIKNPALVEYMTDLKEKKENAIMQIVRTLSNEVSKDELLAVLVSSFRPYAVGEKLVRQLQDQDARSPRKSYMNT